jgi:broad specificity phosphatase PhoE
LAHWRRRAQRSPLCQQAPWSPRKKSAHAHHHHLQQQHQQLSNERFSRLFVSPLRRARQTAEAIATRHPSEAAAAGGSGGSGKTTLADAAEVLPSLREIDLYSFQGLLKARGKARHGPAYALWQKAPERFELPAVEGEGEGGGTGASSSPPPHAPVRELWHRASLAWREILREREGDDDEEDQTVLIVAHNAVNQALVGAALGLGPEHFRRLLQSNGAATVLDFEEGGRGAGEGLTPTRAALDRLNETAGDGLAKALAKADETTAARVVLVRADEAGGGEAAAALAATLSPAVAAGARVARVAYAAGDTDAERLARSLALAQGPAPEADADLAPLTAGEPRAAFWRRAGRAWRRAVAAGRAAAGEDDDGASPPALVVVVASSAVGLAAVVGHALSGGGCEEEHDDDAGPQARVAFGGALRLDRGAATVADVSASPSASPQAVVRAFNVGLLGGSSRPIARAGMPLPLMPEALGG